MVPLSEIEMKSQDHSLVEYKNIVLTIEGSAIVQSS